MTRKAEPHKTRIAIDISVPCEKWPDLSACIESAINTALSEIEYLNPECEVSIVLADDAMVQELNKTYRGKDKPTNVLSFPQDEEFSLGDIILAYETIKCEAEEQGKSLKSHAIHMSVHGLLHLLGYDHEDNTDAEAMESLEIRILKALGIKNPYEEKNSVP